MSDEKSCLKCLDLENEDWCRSCLQLTHLCEEDRPLFDPRPDGEKQTFDDELRRAEAMEKGVDR